MSNEHAPIKRVIAPAAKVIGIGLSVRPHIKSLNLGLANLPQSINKQMPNLITDNDDRYCNTLRILAGLTISN